jgi:hypothetical protein
MAIRDNSVHGGFRKPVGVVLASAREQAEIAPRIEELCLDFK